MLSSSVCKTYNLLLLILISLLLFLVYILQSPKFVNNDIRILQDMDISSDPTVHFDSMDYIKAQDASKFADDRLEPSEESNYDQLKTPGPSSDPLAPAQDSNNDSNSSAKFSSESRYKTAQFSNNLRSGSAPYFGSRTQQNILIVSTWRSGSTTFSGILSSPKEAFLHYEPLDGHFTASLTDPDVTDHVVNITDKLLSCDYENVDDEYLRGMYFRRAYLRENNKLPSSCKGPGRQTSPCLNQTFMAEQCRKYPIQIVKYVRISLAQVAHYLDDYSNFKVIWLTRDPRAVWHSRLNNRMVNFWCLPGLCGDLKRLCQFYEINWELSERLLISHHDSFLRVKFEDIQHNPFSEAEKITKFLDLKNTGDINDKIKLLDDKTSFTTKKDWRDNLTDEARVDVEHMCNATMHELGYL